MNCNDFLYHIDKENNMVYFCPLSVWEEEGYCADCYNEEEWEVINPVLDELDLAEVVHSGFEPINEGVRVQILEPQIIELGFIKDKKFSKFMTTPKFDEVETEDEDFQMDDEDDEEPSELNFDR